MVFVFTIRVTFLPSANPSVRFLSSHCPPPLSLLVSPSVYTSPSSYYSHLLQVSPSHSLFRVLQYTPHISFFLSAILCLRSHVPFLAHISFGSSPSHCSSVYVAPNISFFVFFLSVSLSTSASYIVFFFF